MGMGEGMISICSQYRLNNSLYKGFLIFKYSDALNNPSKKMNFQEQERFYQAFRKSRAASTPKENETVTEVLNGLIVTRPAKKIEHLSTTTQETTTKEPVITELGGSKAGSVQVNKLREILRFQRSNGRF
jgi:hypothetical protein